MKRIAALFAFLFLLFLVSCGAAEPETVGTEPSTPVPPTDGGDGNTATSTTDTASGPGAGVSITSFTPATTVAEAAQLRPDDHTHGVAEPVVAIIEYGDFQ